MPGEHDLCRFCGARIVWWLTTSGARMPVDREPDRLRGNLVLADVAGVTRVVVLSKAALEQTRRLGVELYVPHAADKSCSGNSRKRRAA